MSALQEIIDCQDRIRTQQATIAALQEALERYIGKFGNCGTVYDAARAAIAAAEQPTQGSENSD